MSGRFPGAPDPQAFWDLLLEGRDGVTEAPADRPWMRELYDPRPRTPGKVPTTRGGFLPALDRFDAAFFDMSPREARRTDPQLRILLETAHEAAQDAGVPVRLLGGERTGVFMGGLHDDYWMRQVGDLAALDIYAELGGVRCALAGRVAYAFGIRGPVLLVDTACSSSLTAVHLACQSLRAGECDLALAGGSNVILTPYHTVTFGEAGALSPEGRCLFGDASANGYVRSEAVGVVVLKPLARALADGDRVRAVILGSAINNDGFTGSGMASPTVEGKVELMRAAYANAGVDPRDVAFIEAHGTGTAAGDPVELRALSEVLGPRGRERARCLVGSAKVNVGHSEGAAGVVGLIKAVLCLEHRMVPGNPQLARPTPAIDWDTAPLRLPFDPVVLPKAGRLLAGVNSYGASGSNAHLVLSTAPEPPTPRRDRPEADRPGILTISARSATALRVLAARYADLLDPADGNAPPLHEVCAAAATRRDHLERRLALVADSASGMASALRDFLADKARPGTTASPDGGWTRPRIVFVYPGQGSHWHGMGRELLAGGGPFSEALDACDAVIREQAGWSLIDALRGDDPAWLQQTAKIQPALWAMGLALTAQWRSWGIEPDAVLGHSQGEIAAAYCAGALTLKQSGRISCLRAALIDELAPPGAMCWVEQPHTKIPALLKELGVTASIAVVESPSSTVLSGDVDPIERIITDCERRGISCLRVQTDYAAHSPQIDPIRQPLLDGLAGLVPGATTVPFLSTVTGVEVPGAALDREYWWRNLREPVLLDETVRSQRGPQPVVFLQMSPHPVLATALKQIAADCGAEALVLESLRRGRPELPNLVGSLAALYTAGCDPDWQRVLGKPTGFVDLPRYPWQRTRHWHQAPDFPWPPIGHQEQGPTATQKDTETSTMQVNVAPNKPDQSHPLLGARVAGTPNAPVWGGRLDRERNRFLLDHRIADQAVMPGAGFIEIALAAAARLCDGRPGELRDIELRELLLLDDEQPWSLELKVTAEAKGEGWRLSVASRADAAAQWTGHAEALIAPVVADTAAPATRTLDEIRARCPDWQAGEHFYREQARSGNTWQGAFRGIAELWRGAGEVLARLRPAAADGELCFHPATLDSCLQAIASVQPVRPETTDAGDRGFVLLGVGRLRLHRQRVSGKLWAHVRQAPAAVGELCADVTVLDDAGATVAEISGVRGKDLAVRPEGSPPPDPPTLLAGWRHTLHWREVPAAPVPAEGGAWLLLCGGTALDSVLTRALSSAGCAVSTVRSGSRFATEGPGRFRADPRSQEDLARVLKDASRSAPLRGVVSLWALACGTSGDASPREVQWTATDLCASLLPLARALQQVQRPDGSRLFLLTRGAQDAIPGDGCPAPWQAALWGFGQTLGFELPTCATTLVDLDANPGTGSDEAREGADLATLLLAPGPEDRLALRGGRRFAPRLLPGAPPDAAQPEALALGSSGGIAGLSLVPDRRPPPGPGQIEIEVSHAGLNYRDVLATVGMLSSRKDSPLVLGIECAGTVTRVGAGVDTHAVGDPVLACTQRALRSHVVVDARFAVRKPEGLTPAEASSVLVAYVTAYHALVELAQVRPSERVLIHSATGGVGLAAMEVARWRGATVVGTAGTPAKRDLLLKLGAARVADSRTTGFAQELRSGNGEHGGVDVILNTLVGDAVEANFSLLNPLGRYVDVAENDVSEGRPLSMAVFSQGRSYLPVNFLDIARFAPDRMGELLRTVIGLIGRGELPPIRHRVFPIEEAADAFTLMARAGHIGKLTLRFPPAREGRPPARPAIRSDATYLVTGGLSGIGELFATWLVDQGARHLVLTGRRALIADATAADLRAAFLARLRSSGAEVEYAAVDVADPEAMAALLRSRQERGLPPVAGVTHSAVALEPARITDLSEADLDQALRAKVAGGWTLHHLFADRPLDFFVLFSSGVSLLSGLRIGFQLGAYAAANAFLDALVAHRRARGLPATGVNWGYWTQTGLAHRLSEASGREVRPAGMLVIRPQDAPALFAAMLETDGRMVCLPADWQTYATAHPQDAGAPILRDLLGSLRAGLPAPAPVLTPQPPPPVSRTAPTPRAAPDPVRAERALAPPSPESTPAAPAPGVSALEDWLALQMAKVLGLSVEEVDRTRPLNRLGLDSLMAAELRNRLRRDHGYEVTIPHLLRVASLRALAIDLAGGVHGSSGGAS